MSSGCKIRSEISGSDLGDRESPDLWSAKITHRAWPSVWIQWDLLPPVMIHVSLAEEWSSRMWGDHEEASEHKALIQYLFNRLSPHDALKHHFTSLKTDLISLQPRVSERKFPWNWFINEKIFFCNFKTTSNHLHPLRVENCDSNSRLVVDEDDNSKFRLERVKHYIRIGSATGVIQLVISNTRCVYAIRLLFFLVNL